MQLFALLCCFLVHFLVFGHLITRTYFPKQNVFIYLLGKKHKRKKKEGEGWEESERYMVFNYSKVDKYACLRKLNLILFVDGPHLRLIQ